MISDAAVLGQSFGLEGLAALSQVPAAELTDRLHSLVRREFLTLISDPRSPDHGQYLFVQALIREVAYNSLAKRDRKTRHLAAARFFESLDTDEIAGALAGHYLAAYQNSAEGAEADALAGQARIALRAAADRATSLGSHGSAHQSLEQALTVTTDPRETAEILGQAGEAAEMDGRHEAAEAHLRRAVDLRRTLGDRPAIAAALAALSRQLSDISHPQDALSLLEPAAEEFADIATDPAGIAVMSQLARAHFLIGDDRRAIEVADLVLEAAEHADLKALIADTLITKGSALGTIGRVIEGSAIVIAGRDVAAQLGLVATVLRALNNLSGYQGDVDPRLAEKTANEGLALARRLGARRWIPNMLSGRWEQLVRFGDWETIRSEMAEALTDEWEDTDRATLLTTLVQLGAMRGEAPDEGLAELRGLIGRLDDHQLDANLVLTEAWVALASGDLEAAASEFRRSVTIWPVAMQVALPQSARATLWAGELAAAADDLVALTAAGLHGPALAAALKTVGAGIAAREGRTADAMSGFRGALRAWRDLGLTWDEALCGLDMAILLDVTDPEVRTAAESAREILVRLEAMPMLARLDAALARSGEVASEPDPATRGAEAGDAPTTDAPVMDTSATR